MITKQHAAMYFMALAAKNDTTKEEFWDKFMDEVPWVLLPDGIRAYIGARQASHFEVAVGGGYSWMEFPDEETLKQLTRENASELVKFYVVPDIKPCVIGEDSYLEVCAVHNWSHKHYRQILIHLVQDIILDSVLRKDMVNVEKRFIGEFQPYHNASDKLSGTELRQEIARFEELGFLKLVGAVYNCTGILLNREWFDTYVYEALKRVYPAELADSTYKYMAISDEMNERINAKRFEFTEEENHSLRICSDLQEVLNKLYSWAYDETLVRV